MNKRHVTFVQMAENMEKHSSRLLSVMDKVADTIASLNA